MNDMNDMNTPHHHQCPEQLARLSATPSPRLASDIIGEGYVSYQQAVVLGFVPTLHSLYTGIMTIMRDIHDPDAYNVASLLGWLVAYDEHAYSQHPLDLHLSLASLHLRLASTLVAPQGVSHE